MISPIKEPTSELLARTSPSLFDVLVAIAGGTAGIIEQTRRDKANNIIPGVAMAKGGFYAELYNSQFEQAA